MKTECTHCRQEAKPWTAIRYEHGAFEEKLCTPCFNQMCLDRVMMLDRIHAEGAAIEAAALAGEFDEADWPEGVEIEYAQHDERLDHRGLP